MHTWTKEDDLMVLFAYKFGFDKCPLTKQQMAERIGTSVGSVGYRVSNFASLEGEGHADHAALLTKAVFQEYGRIPMEKLKAIAFG
ncbi:hypothetical protein AGMMS50225_10570 [Betaproteobacteria bacterium]|nr:hypothetical protein AGMMS50225_10570 [Betaproteobacteria bacterium]